MPKVVNNSPKEVTSKVISLYVYNLFAINNRNYNIFDTRFIKLIRGIF